MAILGSARAEAELRGWAVAIAVVDDGGHCLGQLRLDHAAPMTSQISLAKARTAALARRDTAFFETLINQGRTALVAAPCLDGALEGGIPVLVGNQVVGAVGVSGVQSGQDLHVALTGLAALAPLEP